MKPRLLYIRAPYDHLSPILIEPLIHKIEKGLRAHFDVTLVSQDFDYSEAIEKIRPDMVLFDGTIESQVNRRLKITNTNTHLNVPRAGMMRIDALSPSRTTFMAEMEHWGVDTYFTNVDTSMGDSFVEAADRLFYWPMFIDPEVYHDYGLPKVIPVLMVGYFESEILEYQWRSKVKKPLMDNYPCLYYRHPGYELKATTTFSINGEALARSLNASMFAPTCGAMKKIVVAKHLEIVGAKCCLITEETPAIRAFGFRDMENCVFATPENITDKINHLVKNPDQYQRILEAGYNHVQQNHTPAQRNQMVQWLKLKQNLKPGYKIVQPDLFGEFQAVPKESPVETIRITGATDLALIRAGIQALSEKRFDDARHFYHECLKFVPYMCEPQLGLGIADLFQGRAKSAFDWIKKPVDFVFSFVGFEPDPIEWAYLIIAILCNGEVEKAIQHAGYFTNLRRRELHYAQWLAFSLVEAPTVMTEIERLMSTLTEERRSIHALPRKNLKQFRDDVIAMLTACGHPGIAEKLGQRPLPANDGSSPQ